MDIERGKIRRWKRNKREIAKFILYWKKKHPMRELLLNEKITIPDEKSAFVDWLNDNFGDGK
jgi:hypothetical protein